jgi:hypothetical protein
MTHYTLHAPSGTTITFSWTTAGYDAVAFPRDGMRSSLVDEVATPRSLWATARWMVEAAGLGGVDDLGEVLVATLVGPERGETDVEHHDEIARLVGQLQRMRA